MFGKSTGRLAKWLIKLWEGGVSKDNKLREYVTNEMVFETSWIESNVRISRRRGTARFVRAGSGGLPG